MIYLYYNMPMLKTIKLKYKYKYLVHATQKNKADWI